MRSKRLPGLAVFSLATGDQIGRVRRPVIDPEPKRVTALFVSVKGSFSKRLLPIDAVHAMGNHAITVQKKDALRAPKDAEPLWALAEKERVDLVGAPVITAGGELIGRVRDYEIAKGGDIAALYVSSGIVRSLTGNEIALPGQLLIALGKDAALVADEALKALDPPPRSSPKPAPVERAAPERLPPASPADDG